VSGDSGAVEASGVAGGDTSMGVVEYEGGLGVGNSEGVKSGDLSG
jgi:hypothetical protein